MKTLSKLIAIFTMVLTSNQMDAQCYVNAGQDITICCSGGTDTLRATPNMTFCACTNYSYSWTPAIGLSNPNGSITAVSPTVTTVYQVCVTAYKGRGCGIVCCTACDSVTVTVNNSCCRLGNFGGNGITAVKGNSGVNVYPNPAKTDITIEFTKKFENPEVMLYDVSGKLVWSKTGLNEMSKLNADFSTLPKGIYFLKVYSKSDEVYNEKIVLE